MCHSEGALLTFVAQGAVIVRRGGKNLAAGTKWTPHSAREILSRRAGTVQRPPWGKRKCGSLRMTLHEQLCAVVINWYWTMWRTFSSFGMLVIVVALASPLMTGAVAADQDVRRAALAKEVRDKGKGPIYWGVWTNPVE